MRSTLRVYLALGLILGSVTEASAADSKAIEATPQAKVYRASVKAIEAGDEKAYAKTLSSQANEQMEKLAKQMEKTTKDMMGLLQIMQPKDVQLTDLKVEGKAATMKATGKAEGETMYASIDLVEENGQWKVNKQAWSNTKP